MDYFTSDHHFGHENMLKFYPDTRPYRSVAAMGEDYVQRWNATVGTEQTVWYLGDFSLDASLVPRYLPRLNGRKHLVVGNHDTCFHMQTAQVDAYMAAGFESVHRVDLWEREGKTFVLCHFPYRPKPTAELAGFTARLAKFAEHTPVAGDWGEDALIHGHVHKLWRARIGNSGLPEINVAIDAWEGRPVSETQILALYREAAARQGTGQIDSQGEWGPLAD